jgi:hypothetical protein
MRIMLCTFAMCSLATVTQAGVPSGPDEINGAFARMLEHEAVATMPSRANAGVSDDRLFERWVNTAARGETSSLEAGFARMLARCDEDQQAPPVRGERDPLAALFAEALQAQQRAGQRLARQ